MTIVEPMTMLTDYLLGAVSLGLGARLLGKRMIAAGLTFVASTTVSRPRRARRAAMKKRTANAAGLALWSPSSSETSNRHWSEERTSLGLKLAAAKLDLPAPAGPTRATSEDGGRTISRLTKGADAVQKSATAGITFSPMISSCRSAQTSLTLPIAV